ncbi:MAG: hypothetical protein J07HQW2_03878, partial [Haloquadratum walsbyi J07HQW2]
ELEEVVGDEFDLCEELLPPGPEVPHVADMFDDLLIGERAHRVRAVAILSETLHVDGVLAEEVVARRQLPIAEAVGLSVDSRSADTGVSDATSVVFTVIIPDSRAY